MLMSETNDQIIYSSASLAANRMLAVGFIWGQLIES